MAFTGDQYVQDILDGTIPAAEYVIKACQRHVNDLETGPERGLYYDQAAVDRVLRFVSRLCKHWEGEWAGQPVKLAPWQQFVTGQIFGWRRADGTRRYRTALIEVARKNGKTTWASALGLYLMMADQEAGAQIYTAATMRNQAKIAHESSKKMVKASSLLSKECIVLRDNINHPATNSKYEPLGSNYDSLDGLNAHAVIADEVHAWSGRGLWDVLETSTGTRRQPLMLAITTAGTDRQSLLWTLHDYTQKILDGLVEDDSFFGIIYSLDVRDEQDEGEGDDWEDESLWIKANPNLGVSKKWDDIRRKARRAKAMPSALNAFLRLELNIWTQAESRWLHPDKWAACGVERYTEADLEGRKCWAGLDLSSTTDLTAFAMVFPPSYEGETWKVIVRLWVPTDNLLDRVKIDRVPYDAWERQGYLFTTEGAVIDTDAIIAQIEQDAARFDIQQIAFDRWGATKVRVQMEDLGFQMVQFGQGFASMNAPTKQLEALVLSRQLAHNNNPALAWMAANVVVRTDPAGNKKPDKDKSVERIDGIVALLMGLELATRNEQSWQSVYETEGLLVL